VYGFYYDPRRSEPDESVDQEVPVAAPGPSPFALQPGQRYTKASPPGAEDAPPGVVRTPITPDEVNQLDLTCSWILPGSDGCWRPSGSNVPLYIVGGALAAGIIVVGGVAIVGAGGAAAAGAAGGATVVSICGATPVCDKLAA
jgi:hypothetical protein